MLWPDQQKKLLYDFYDRMNSTNTINHLGESQDICNEKWLEKNCTAGMG